MRTNINSYQAKTEEEKAKMKHKGIKAILVAVIILNCLIASVLLLSIITSEFFNLNLQFDSDSLLVIYGTLIFSILISSLYILNLYLFKKGKFKFPVLLSNMSLMVFVISVLLIITEVVFRSFFSHYAINIYSYNKKFQKMFMNPNLNELLFTSEYKVNYRTNSIGLRGEQEFTVKRPNETRIVVLGDSFIQAAQVSEKNTMCNILEEMLNNSQAQNRIKKEFNVINTAMSGWTPTDEREFLEKNYRFFEPDVVMLFIYVGNDFHETIANLRHHKSRQDASIVTRFLKSSKNLMLDSSKLFTFVYKRITDKKWPMGRSIQPFNHPETNVFNVEYNSKIKQAYQIVETEIIRINEICKKNGSNLYLCIIPTKEQIDKSKLQETVDFLNIDLNQFNLTKPQNMLSNFARQKKIKMVDLLDTLRIAGKDQPVYFTIDSHWNDFGNYVAAKTVFNFLNKNNVLIKL